METNRAFYVGIVFLLLAVDWSFFNWKVNVMAKTDSVDPNKRQGSSEQTGVLNSVSDSNKGTQLAKSMENIDKKNNNGKNKNNDEESGQSGSRGTGNVEKDNGKLKEKSQAEIDDNEKKKKTTMSKENSNQGDSVASVKDSHVEDCDPSNKCIDDENKFFACLRVPGNDPQYSLLIQNKVKKPLVVAISAPDFVQLEKTEIQLQSEGNQKVEVSISKGGSENLIVLKAGNGHCNLDINHLIAENSNSEKSTYVNFMSRTRMIVVLSFGALLVLAAGWAFVSFRRKQLSSVGGAAKYRRLDADLPVSTGEKAEPEHSEGWDNSWGDDWDDEEAPKTPSMPLTPSLSAKGLASRRLSKEGWKD